MKMPFVQQYYHNVEIALECIKGNKLKSFLTALGIVFGVAAVISMMAIGNGAKQEILEQIKQVGVNNIILSPIDPQAQKADGESESEGTAEGQEKSKRFSPGLTLKDAELIKELVPGVAHVSSLISSQGTIIGNGISRQGKLVGVDVDYFDIYDLRPAAGNLFSEVQVHENMAVCVIGANVRMKYFSQTAAVGSYIKFDSSWWKIVGVLERTGWQSEYNDQIFVPINSMLLRVPPKSTSGSGSGNLSGITVFGGGRIIIGGGGAAPPSSHQPDQVIVQVKESSELLSIQELISRMVLRQHQGVHDTEISAPEMLLKQQQRSTSIFNIVLGAIAGISLLVGGIGIMNIMFASVMERTKEIGTRLAIGAKKVDVAAQFLAEAVLISVTGGLIGVFLGVGLSYIIERAFDIKSIVSFVSILVSFAVSVAVGIVFGYAPAKRASERDPIESLRYE
jgi:ABC-type antimicrobial peptide transport system, permease component